MAVEGRLGASSDSYPVVLDTGAAGTVFVNDVHLREDLLPVLRPTGEHIGPERRGAVRCQLDRVRIGPIVLEQPPCWYVPLQGESDDVATPTHRDNSVIVGLAALQELSYLMFDNIGRETELSYGAPFRPEDPGLWSKHPLEIRYDARGYPSLLTELTVAGERICIQLDTGSGRGLTVTETLWKRLSKKLPGVRFKRGADFYPYIGRLPCRRSHLDQLQIGARTIRHADLSVFPDDSVLFGHCYALAGMQYFQDTAIVLDFQGRTLWVRIHNPHSRA